MNTHCVSGFAKTCFFVLALAGFYYPASAVAADSGSQVQVIGQIHFEKHRTLTTLEYPADSKPYWVVVVDTETSSYELGQAFALGSDSEPESIEVSDVKLRPGDRVLFEGQLQAMDRSHGILSNLTRVEVLMDDQVDHQGSSPGPGIITIGRTPRLPSDPLNWYCHGELSTGEKVYTEVWYSGLDGNSRIFHISGFTEARGELGISTEFLRLDHAVELRLGDSYSYRGVDGDLDARLTITRKPIFTQGVNAGSAEADGTLEIRNFSPNLDLHSSSKIDLSCSTGEQK